MSAGNPMGGARTGGAPMPLALLGVYGAVVAALLALAPRLAQPASYHAFADQRAWLGIPHFADVTSNLALLAGGLAGLLALRSTAAVSPLERRLWGVFFAAVCLTAFGSAYYHWAPDTPRLFWDRLPLGLALACVPALLTAERAVLAPRAVRLLWLWVLVGPASAVWWFLSEVAGRGDLRPYLVMQGVSLLAGVLLLARPTPFSHGRAWAVALGCYVLAVLAERYDAAVYGLGGVVAGHTLKHLAAGAGVGLLAWMLTRRRWRA